MIIKCPYCGRRFELQRRPPETFRCPKCSYKAPFSAVLENKNQPSAQSKTADGDMTGPARSLPTDMAVISEGTVVDELADKTKLVPELQAKETQVVPGLQPRRKGVFKVRYQGMELPMVVLPPAGSYTLGRKSSDSTARIKVAPDIRMSRVHAGMRTVVANGGTNNYQITSLKDDNPVYVNGRPVPRNMACNLKPGDKIRMGETEMTFQLM